MPDAVGWEAVVVALRAVADLGDLDKAGSSVIRSEDLRDGREGDARRDGAGFALCGLPAGSIVKGAGGIVGEPVGAEYAVEVGP
jgi:hypothetical protein